ncbi:MAG: hypothetical protein KAS29_22210, partial [Bacteroidales bacterium]|nr:hypothetical protein [Bacteroidales bacterium]
MTNLQALFIITCFLPCLLWGCKGSGKAQPETPSSFPVFIAGDEPVRGYQSHTYAQFREQNILVTNSGKIVTIVQGRNVSAWSDRS